MAQNLLQPSFAGGELDPALWGRVDIDRYGIGARSIENWIVLKTGGLQSRPGWRYVNRCGIQSEPVRVLSFSVSDEFAYVVELGNQYARFHYRGATVVDGLNVPVKIITPWNSAQVFDVSFTQSADTMFIAHGNYMIRLIKRTGASAFTIETFKPREGPFRNLNANESRFISASAKVGTVTVTSNFDLFTADMVGGLIYMEPKTLGQIKPWVQGERTTNLATGVLRRSEGKVYRASNVPAPPAGAGNFTETGNVRPIHEFGKAWDGPADTRSISGGVSWIVGVEWEYMHSGYGIVEITGYTDQRTATCVVKKTLPDEVVGGVGTPANTWTFSGDGVTKTFSVTGATNVSNSNYTVEISSIPEQSDPNYVPPDFGDHNGGGDFGGGYYVP